MSKDAAKKKSGKQEFSDDPPIIVGGGGSTYVWIKNGLTITPVSNPATIPHPPPKTPANDQVWRVDVDITAVDANNGKGGIFSHVGHSNMDKDKFRTVFDT
jgi:hypothetical protein